MQIYRGMDVGTAKPTEEERSRVPHHMIDVAEPSEQYSVTRYKAEAEAAMSEIISRGHIPVFCGGTGLYLDAILYDNKFSEDPGNDKNGDGKKVRDELALFAEKYGAEALHARLAEVDPESARATHPNNVRRVVRALEIFERTGRKKSEWDAGSRLGGRRHIAVIGLRFEDRALHREAIRRRCREMMTAGWSTRQRGFTIRECLRTGCPPHRR